MWFSGFFFSYFVSHSWGIPMMKITGLSHLFKWENLHNWWLTKYFFAPLYNQARNRLTKEIRVAKKNYFEKLKKKTFSKRSGISMDWSEEHHQVQDTSPTVCGESTTGWWSQCVLLPIWKGQTDTQLPLWSALHNCPPPPHNPHPSLPHHSTCA